MQVSILLGNLIYATVLNDSIFFRVCSLLHFHEFLSKGILHALGKKEEKLRMLVSVFLNFSCSLENFIYEVLNRYILEFLLISLKF